MIRRFFYWFRSVLPPSLNRPDDNDTFTNPCRILATGCYCFINQTQVVVSRLHIIVFLSFFFLLLNFFQLTFSLQFQLEAHSVVNDQSVGPGRIYANFCFKRSNWAPPLFMQTSTRFIIHTRPGSPFTKIDSILSFYGINKRISYHPKRRSLFDSRLLFSQ